MEKYKIIVDPDAFKMMDQHIIFLSRVSEKQENLYDKCL